MNKSLIKSKILKKVRYDAAKDVNLHVYNQQQKSWYMQQIAIKLAII